MVGMLETLSNIKGLEIYTPEGLLVGVADELVVNMPDMKISGIYVDRCNPALVDENVAISIPFTWVRGIGDVIILKTFPSRVSSSQRETPQPY